MMKPTIKAAAVSGLALLLLCINTAQAQPNTPAGPAKPSVTRPAHGAGSSGDPRLPYREDIDEFRPERVNAQNGMMHGAVGENSISDWNSHIAASLSQYRILMSSSSNAARVGITNCDKPYFDSSVNNMRFVIRRLQQIRDHIQTMQGQLTTVLAETHQLQESTIENMGEPNPIGVDTAVEEVIGQIPIAGGLLNAGGDEADRRVKLTLWEAQQKKRRLREWAPVMADYLQRTNQFLTQGQGDVDAVTRAFNPSVCHVCGQSAKAETPAAPVNMPPASSVPTEPNIEAINRVIQEFRQTAQAAIAGASQKPVTPVTTPAVGGGGTPGRLQAEPDKSNY